MAKTKISVDDLALMLQKEFNEIHPRLAKIDGIERRIGGMERNIEVLKKDDQMILKRLEGVVYRTEFEKLEIRVHDLEDLLAFNGRK